MSARDTVTVRVPASTSNCGSGFDTLGLAVQLYGRVTVTRRAAGSGTAARRTAGRSMGDAAGAAFFQRTGLDPFAFGFAIDGGIPPGRGLGSSAVVRVGVIAGLNALAGSGLAPRQIVELATALEGHPDNAAAAVFGGFCVSRTSPVSGAYLDGVRITVPPDLAFVVVAPRIEMRTGESRSVLPGRIPHLDAVRSVNAAAFLVAAFATGEYARLKHAVADFLHEPYRLPRIPGGRKAIESGVAAGALTGWLSGSGSGVLCVCERPAAAGVRAAMAAALARAGGDGGSWVLTADNDGFAVE
jgi:homoserine kinase